MINKRFFNANVTLLTLHTFLFILLVKFYCKLGINQSYSFVLNDDSEVFAVKKKVPYFLLQK